MTTGAPLGRASETGSDTVSLAEAARRLGVHYMTAYRYVRLGLLPADRRGNRWTVRAGDLEGWSPRAARSSQAARGPRVDRYRRSLLHTLLAGDEAAAWRLAEAALARGIAPADLYVRVLGPCLRLIGERWQFGELSVAEEHRASTVATRLVGRLGPQFNRTGPERAGVVLAGAPGDIHQLPAALVRDVVRGAGYRVIDLGGNTPAEVLATVVARAEAIAVCLSVSTAGNETSVRSAVTASRRARLDIPVLIGGPAIPDGAAAGAMGADGWAADALGLVGVLDGLSTD